MRDNRTCVWADGPVKFCIDNESCEVPDFGTASE
jgi:hypothetical protein